MDPLSGSGFREALKGEQRLCSFPWPNHLTSFTLTLRLQKGVAKESKADVIVCNGINGKISAVTLLFCSLKTQLFSQYICLWLPLPRVLTLWWLQKPRCHSVCFLLSIEEKELILQEEKD